MEIQDDFQSNSNSDSLTVYQLTVIIKDLLQNSLPEICVEGEISNWKPSSMGHCYFTLKDDKAAISAVMFKYSTGNLKFVPQDGMKVRIKGSISVYEVRGTYQIKVNSMEQIGEGNLLQIIEERKRKLDQEGLFDEKRKKKLPFFPGTVGVVTSPTGAVFRDVLRIITRRNDKINIIIFPCAVQGSEAAEQITRQIKIANFYNLCDVLIIGRGGGSLEDLMPFSEETVVRAIAESKIPTISAVGHEPDVPISDFAADVRASTPSAAAEIASPLISEIYSQLEGYQADFFRNISNRIDNCRANIRNFSTENLVLRFRNIESPYLQRFDSAKEQLIANFQNLLNEKKQKFELAKNSLESLNPKGILERGYSLVYDEKGHLVKDTCQVEKGSKIKVALAKGKLDAQVIDKE